MTALHDFHHHNERLQVLGAIGSAAELQAYFCARLLLQPKADEAILLADALKFLDLHHFPLKAEEVLVVKDLCEESRQMLKEETFNPLLPGPELSLQRRSEELGAWCRGFLHGFGSAGLAGDAEIPANVSEVLKDFAKISQVVQVEQEENDDNLNYLEEIIAYLGTGLKVVQAEMGFPQPTTLH